jgi:hypothetical protein
VVVKYLAGPAIPADPQDSRSLAVSEPEARSGIFHLQRFGQLGLEVCNETEEGMLNRVTFIPWEAVLSIMSTTEQESAGGGNRLSREQVAELAQRTKTSEAGNQPQSHPGHPQPIPYARYCVEE